MTAALNNVAVDNSGTASNGVTVDGTGGTGTFTFTAGGTNTIKSSTGIGLNLNNVSIGAAGELPERRRQRCNERHQNEQCHRLRHGHHRRQWRRGGLWRFFDTTGDAIVMTNTASTVVQHVHVLSAGGMGVNVDHTTAATTDMAIRFTDFDLDGVSGTAASMSRALATRMHLVFSCVTAIWLKT